MIFFKSLGQSLIKLNNLQAIMKELTALKKSINLFKKFR